MSSSSSSVMSSAFRRVRRASLVVAVAAASVGIAAPSASAEPPPPPPLTTIEDLRAAVDAFNVDCEDKEIYLAAGTFTFSGTPLTEPGDDANLTGDIDVSDTCDSYELHIYGAGQSDTILDANNVDRFFDVWDGDLYLHDLTITNGRADGDTPPNGDGGAIRVNAWEDAYLTDVTITNSVAGEGGAIYTGDDAYLELRGTSFSGNYADDGGAIYMGYSSNTDINGSDTNAATFSGNEAGDEGGAIRTADETDLYIYGATFATNTAGLDGGAIFSDNDSYLSADRSWEFGPTLFIENTSGANGGAIYLGDYGDADFNGVAMTENVAGNNAGAFFIEDYSTVQFNVDDSGNQSELSGNEADQDGGAVFVDNNAVLEMYGVYAHDNIAGDDGGAVKLDSSADATITWHSEWGIPSEFSTNHAASDGGAIYLAYNDELWLSYSSLHHNTAAEDGGAIHSQYGGNAYIGDGGSSIDTEVVSNTATIDGGGIHAAGGSNINVTTTRIATNSAGFYGGGVASDGEFDINNSVIEGNHAGDEGGGFSFSNDYTSNIDKSLISANDATNDGGGIYVGSDTDLYLTNSTLSGNTSVNGAGGLGQGCCWENSYLTHVTVAKNSGPQLDADADNGGYIELDASIVVDAISGDNCWGVDDSAGYSVSDDSSCTSLDVSPLSDPTLDLLPLADNGGSTMTHRLVPGQSPVDYAYESSDGYDQRGYGRPGYQSGNDAGAFEIQPYPELKIEKTANVTTGVAGDTVIWEIKVTNVGDEPAWTYMYDWLSEDLNFESFSPESPESCTFNDWDTDAVYCDLGYLAGGASVTVTVITTIDDGWPTTIDNTAYASCDGCQELDLYPNTDYDEVFRYAPDLAVLKVSDKSSVAAGDLLTYTIAVANLDYDGMGAPAPNTVIYDEIPDGLEFVEFGPGTTAAGCAVNGTPGVDEYVQCAQGTLAIDETVIVEIVTIVVDPPLGVIANTASASTTREGCEPDEDWDCNQDYDDENDQFTANVTGVVGDIEVTKVADATTVGTGDQIQYVMTVHNRGSAPVSSVIFSDVLPAGVDFYHFHDVSPDNCEYLLDEYWDEYIGQWVEISETLTCDLGTMGPDGSPTDTAIIDIHVDVDIDALGPISNTATATVEGVEYDDSNNSDTLDVEGGAPDLSVTKVANVTTVASSDYFIYTITVTNEGNLGASGYIDDVLPAGITDSGYAVTATDYYSCYYTLFCEYWLDPGESITFDWTVYVDTGGPAILTNTVDVWTDSQEFDTEDNSASATVTFVAPDIIVTKTADPMTVTYDDYITYTILVENDGTAMGTGVELYDSIPSELLGVWISSDPNEYCGLTGNDLYCSLGNMDVGETYTVTVSGTVGPDALGYICNTADAWADEADLDDASNSGEACPLGPIADLSVTKVASVATAVTGDELTYYILVTNNGDADAQGVEVWDQLPEHVIFEDFGPTTPYGCEAWEDYDSDLDMYVWFIGCEIGELPAGRSILITAHTMVVPGSDDYNPFDDSAYGAFWNEAEAWSETTEGPEENYEDNDDEVVVRHVRPDLVVTKTADKTTVITGDTITYTVVVTNDGEGIATRTAIMDLLPEGIVFDALTEGNEATGCVPTDLDGDSLDDVRVATVVESGDGLGDEFEAGDIIDGTTLAEGDRILIKNQDGYQKDNGIYTVNASGSPTRSSDMDDDYEVSPPTFIMVNEGTVNGGTTWELTDFDGVFGDDILVFELGSPDYEALFCDSDALAPGESVTLEFTALVVEAPDGLFANFAGALGFVWLDEEEYYPQGDESFFASDCVNPIWGEVAAASTDPGDLETDYEEGDYLDDEYLNVGERILIKDQVDPAENGIYVVNYEGEPTRAWDANEDPEVFAGKSVYVNSGDANYDTYWSVLAFGGMLDTDPVFFEQVDWDDYYDALGDYFECLFGGCEPDGFSVPYATTAAGDLATDFEDGDIVDGYTIFEGDLLLVKNQVNPAENGIYVVQLSGAPVRSGGADEDAEIIVGNYVYVYSGDTNSGMYWRIAAFGGTINVTPILFVESSSEEILIGMFDCLIDNIGLATGFGLRPDLTVEKTADVESVVTGDMITYTITVTNEGNAPATSVVVEDELSSDLDFEEFGEATDADYCEVYEGEESNDEVYCLDDVLLPGESITIVVVVTVLDAPYGDIENCAWSESNEPELNDDWDDNSDCVDVQGMSGDIVVTKTANVTTVALGDWFKYTIHVDNVGNLESTDVELHDDLPSEFAFEYFSGLTPGSCYVDWDEEAETYYLHCELGDMAEAGGLSDSYTITMWGTADFNDEGEGEGYFDNCASAYGDAEYYDYLWDNEGCYEILAVAPDLEITKVANVTSAGNGDGFYYTITVTNYGNWDATSVIVTDNLTSDMDWNAFDGCDFDDNDYDEDANPATISLEHEVLAADETITCTFWVLVNGTALGEILNTATTYVDSGLQEANLDDNEDTEEVIGPLPELSVTKTADATTVGTGDILTYTITVDNLGDAPATSVVISDTIPTELVSLSLGGGTTASNCAFDGQELTCDHGTLNDGATAIVEVVGTVDLDETGNFTNTVMVDDSPDWDQTTLNDSDSVTVYGGTPDLEIDKSVDYSSAATGDTIQYTISVTNDGTVPATTVLVADTLPSEVNFVSVATTPDLGTACDTEAELASGCDFGTVNPGDTVEVVVTVTVAIYDLGIFTNTATTSTARQEFDTDDNTDDADVQGIAADLHITKEADLTTVVTGDVLTYTITVYNDGDADATTVVITDALPVEITSPVIDLDATTALGCGLSGQDLTCDHGTLDYGDSVTVVVSGIVDLNGPGTVSNTAMVTTPSQELDSGVVRSAPLHEDNEDTADVEGLTPDIKVTKTGNRTTVATADNLTYTIKVSNIGTGHALGVVMNDVIPGPVNFISVATSSGTCTYTGGTSTLSCNLGTLAVGQMITITVLTKAEIFAPGSFTNTASATTISEDLTPANNFAIATAFGKPIGYWFVASDGGIFSYGDAHFYGSTGGTPPATPVVGMAATPTGQGYWLADSGGDVFNFGDATSLGGVSGSSNGGFNQAAHADPIVGIAPMPTGLGYWLVSNSGQVFAFGSAAHHGDASVLPLTAAIISMTPTPSGLGYWLLASDGGIFSYGDAAFHGSTGDIVLAKPVVGMAATATGNGYWLVASDGGIFSYGDAVFYGSMGGTPLTLPIVGMEATSTGHGYWLVAGDGGIFAFGEAGFVGSTGDIVLNKPIVGMTAVA